MLSPLMGPWLCAQMGRAQGPGWHRCLENPALASRVGILGVFPKAIGVMIAVPFRVICVIYVCIYLFTPCLAPEEGLRQRRLVFDVLF